MERWRGLIFVLLAFGLIMYSFNALSEATLGFTWFVNGLWFALGFPVLVGVGMIAFSLMVAGHEEALQKLKK